MKVRVANHYGMCFGVRDAIEMAMDLSNRVPLTILGDLVHNPDVVARMEAAGASRAQAPGQIETRSVLLTAHGTSDRLKNELRSNGYEIHDATCPLVERAHRALLKLVEEGCFPVVIGREDHIEVRGLTGDLDEHVVVGSIEDLEMLAPHASPERPFGVIVQTTWPLEKAQSMVEAIRARFPEVEARFVDTVCQPTKERQQALRDLAERCDVVIVVGGPDSNNSRKLVELSERLGTPAHRVSNASELNSEWFTSAELVGLTAGTSTPEDVIEQVRIALEQM